MGRDTGPVGDTVQQRLMEQYTELSALAGGLAHEIKNPLSTMQLNLGLLAEEFANPQNVREQRALQKIRIIERECRRLNDILEGFLRFARVQELNLERCDLNKVIQEVVDFVAPEAARRGIELVTYFHAALPLVRLDRNLFKQAILNLVINAEEAMPEGGQIVFQTRPTSSGVELEVIDTGVGMDQEVLSRIFQPFFSTRKDGSGLGLPTTRRIVEAHGGTIRVESAVGKGTRFTISLPAGEGSLAEERQPSNVSGQS